MNADIKLIIEIVGYIGSALVIVSMLMTSVVKLRVINMVGSVIFATYALCIHSYPTAAMQAALIIINIVNLRKLLNTKKEYSISKLDSKEKFVQTFLEHNMNDIKKYFPDFDLQDTPAYAYYIYSNNNSVGILIGKPSGTPASLEVLLDYTTPAYRDTSAGKFLYQKLKEQGITKVTAKTNVEQHKKYLLKMGFAAKDDVFEKML